MISISTTSKVCIDAMKGFKGSDFSQDQYEWTVKHVRAILEPWIELHFGPKCPDYEYGCEGCKRWKLADELLEWYGLNKKQETLEQEIATLEECLKWRKELLAKMKENENAQ